MGHKHEMILFFLQIFLEIYTKSSFHNSIAFWLFLGIKKNPMIQSTSFSKPQILNLMSYPLPALPLDQPASSQAPVVRVGWSVFIPLLPLLVPVSSPSWGLGEEEGVRWVR